MRLTGKVALLTGANDGIGLAAARLFVKEGARVAITGRRKQKGEEAAKELTVLSGDPNGAVFIEGDIASADDTARMVEATIEKFKQLDILVNCAALQIGGTVLQARPEDYEMVFKVNITGYAFSAKAAISYLLKSESPAIVNVASLTGNIGIPDRTLYSVSKAGVIELTKCLACDFPKIRVNCVSPGFTASESMMQGLSMTGIPAKECAELISAGVIMKRMATTDEIANVIFFLASDLSSYITGENIIADGGALCFGNYGSAFSSDPRLKR